MDCCGCDRCRVCCSLACLGLRVCSGSSLGSRIRDAQAIVIGKTVVNSMLRSPGGSLTLPDAFPVDWFMMVVVYAVRSMYAGVGR